MENVLDGAAGWSEKEDTCDSSGPSEHGPRHVNKLRIQGFVVYEGGRVCKFIARASLPVAYVGQSHWPMSLSPLDGMRLD